jgi:hypothetical protein
MTPKKAYSVPILKDDPFLKEFDRIDFSDEFRIHVKAHTFTSAQEVIDTLLKKSPHWISWAMKMRNQAVQLVGLKTENSSEFIQTKQINPNSIQLSGFDKHLDFACLVQLDSSNADQTVSLKTIVKIHNLTGKLYFAIVQHIHPKVVCSLLNSLIR